MNSNLSKLKLTLQKNVSTFQQYYFFYYIPISDFLSTYVAKKLPIVLHNSYLLRPYYNGENI